jgi:AcrR family transcriptional regulator
MEKKRGRPRNKETEKSILEAAWELSQTDGFHKLTIEKIAEQARVGKATIYKWWPNKTAIIMDALFSKSMLKSPLPNTGVLQQDLLLQAVTLVDFLRSMEGKLLIELIAEGQFDVKVAEECLVRYFIPRRENSKVLLRRGIARKELKESAELDMIIDMVFGPLFYKLLITKDAVSQEYIERLVDIVLKEYNIGH